jgi:uncharacterized membrane protein (DUF2068 family)
VEWIVGGLCAYGALFTVEGFGLWLGKRWGEWLTIVATTSFIPFELYELWKRATFTRAAFLAVNVAIVIYLVWRIRATPPDSRAAAPPPSRPRPRARAR